MKMMKLIYPLAFALAVTLTTTGCHNHKAVGITPIPAQPGQVGGGTGPQTLPLGNDMSSERTPNGIPTTNPTDFDNMLQDPSALAAYTIHFAFDSAVIRSSDDANLQSVASALAANAGTKLLIEGNCDERGTEEYNRALGERRALAAREALAKLGLDPSRVRTISYGKDKPVDPGHDEAAWAKNRRDDFVLLRPKTGS